MKPKSLYLLLQLPGVLFIVTLLWWGVVNDALRPGSAVVLFGLWVLKDCLLYPAFRHALRPAPHIGAKALLGQECMLVRAAAPRGQVRVSGEIWSARSRFGEKLPAGMAVRVVDAEWIVLIVEPARRASS